MTNPAAEANLAKFLKFISKIESDIENDRLRLAHNPNFDPFQNFRNIDKPGKGFLDETDLTDFLRSRNVRFDERSLQSLFLIYKDGIPKITFQDFLRHITPKSDPSFKNTFLNRFGLKPKSQAGFEESQDIIAAIYSRETIYLSEFESQRLVLSEIPGLDGAFPLLTGGSTITLTFQGLANFMNRCQQSFQPQDFESLMRRLDTNKRGQVTINDLTNLIYLGELQSSSNYSISGNGNFRYELPGSMFDSITSPIREVASFNQQNIKVNETYMPPTHGGAHHLPHQPIQIIDQKPPIILPPKHIVNPEPKVIVRPIPTPVGVDFYSSKIAAIKDHPLYHQPPVPKLSHVVTNVETIKREIPARLVATHHVPPPHVVTLSPRLNSPSRLGMPSRLTSSPSRLVAPTRLTSSPSRLAAPSALLTRSPPRITAPSSLTGNYLQPAYKGLGALGASGSRLTTENKSMSFGAPPLRSDYKTPSLLHLYSKGKDEGNISVSPIRRRTSVDANAASNLNNNNHQYITPNLPPKYQLASTQNEGLSKTGVEPRLSYSRERPLSSGLGAATTTPPPMNKVDTRVPYSSKIDSYVSRLGQRPSSGYLNEPPKLHSLLEKNTKNLDSLLNDNDGIKKSYVLESQYGLGGTDKGRKSAKEGQEVRPSGTIAKQEDIRRSTVLESYKNENAHRSGMKVGGYGGYGTDEKGKGSLEMKTEVEQSVSSSYKFANSKYEQLWGDEGNNE